MGFQLSQKTPKRDTHVTVLTTRRIGEAIRMETQRVDRTEMALDASELLLEDQMVEARLELAGSGRGGGDLHRLLTTTERHVILDRRDGRRVHRSIGLVGFQVLERLAVEQLRGRVLARGDEHRLVHVVLQVVDLRLVLLRVQQFLFHVSEVPLGQQAGLVAENHRLVQRTPQSGGRLVVPVELVDRDNAALGVRLEVGRISQVDHLQRGGHLHRLVGCEEQHLARVREVGDTHRRSGLQFVQLSAGLQVPVMARRGVRGMMVDGWRMKINTTIHMNG